MSSSRFIEHLSTLLCFPNQSCQVLSAKTAHLASILMMSLPLPIFLADPQELDLLPEKIEITVPSLRKPRICSLCELSNLHLHLIVVRSTTFCQSTDKILPRNRFALMSGSEKSSLLMKQSTSSRFALIIQSFSCSSPVEQFSEVQELQVNHENLHWDTVIAKGLLQSDLVSDGDFALSA